MTLVVSTVGVRLRSLLAVLGACSTMGGCLATSGEPNWGYSGATGPEHWADLSPAHAACGLGVNQSPVDLQDAVPAVLETISFDYSSGATDVYNNGHTVQINAEPGNLLRIGDETVELEQLHFHSPSEHRIDGRSFPLEAHLVHRDAHGGLAVVAILFEEGDPNPELQRIGESAPSRGETVPSDLDFTTLEMHHEHESYFRYGGSLTTPPCTEGVRWFVLKETGFISAEQAAAYVELIGEDARGPQPINARIILEH